MVQKHCRTVPSLCLEYKLYNNVTDRRQTDGACKCRTSVASIPIPGGLSLRPVKNRGEIYIFVWMLLFEFIILILYYVLQCFMTSLLPLCPVQHTFIANCSDGDNINFHSAFLHLHFAQIFFDGSWRRGGRRSSRKGE